MAFTNPYVAGNPVGGMDQFIGRQDILSKLRRNLAKENANVLVLSGRRRIGKTSILRQLENNLSDSCIPLYFNLEGKANLPENDVLLELANAIATVIYSHPFPNELMEMLTGDRFTFRNFLDELEDQIENRSLILLFDEFDAIEKADDPQQFRQASNKLFTVLRQLTTFNAEQIQCVFAIGRDVQELDEKNQLSLIKGADNIFVSLLNQSETENVVRLSEQQGSLNWSDEAIKKVWDLTHGHPYLTQRLCAIIWDNANLQNNSHFSRFTVRLEMVEEAAVEAIQHGQFALQWIWRGLLPAQRVIASAMAEMTTASFNSISQQELNKFLSENGVGLRTRRLEKAADKLVEWDFLVKIEIESEERYRFNIELMRRWLVAHKPLEEAMSELEQENRAANNFYNRAVESHRQKNLEQAARKAEQAVLLNPNHLTARLFWAQILFDLRRISEAVTQLSMAYDHNRRRAELPYAKALLKQAKSQHEPLNKRWQASQTSLEIIQKSDSGEVQALKESALKVQDELAGQYYQQAKKYEAEKKWDEAISIYQKLSKVLPNPKKYPWYEDAWQNLIALTRAKQALETGHTQRAKQLLYSILSREEEHEKAKKMLMEISGHQTKKILGGKPKKDPIIVQITSSLWRWEAIVPLILIIIVAIAIKWQDINNVLFGTPTVIVTPPTKVVSVTVSPTSTKVTPTVTVSPTSTKVTPSPVVEFVLLGTLNEQGHSDQVSSVAFSPDGTRLASGGADGQIFLWNPEDGTKEILDEHNNVEVLSVAFSPNGTRLAYGLSNNTIWLWEVNSDPRELAQLPNRVQSVAFSSNGLLAAGASDGTIQLWDLENNESRDPLKDPGAVQNLSFSPDGSRLASGGPKIRWWDVESGQVSPLEEAELGGWIVYSVAFSLDGHFMASGSEDGTVRVWNVDSRTVIHLFSGHGRHVRSVTFSSDGQILASGSRDGTVRLWDVSRGTPLGYPLEHPADVLSVAFSPDGTRLAAGLADGTISLWGLSEP